MEKIPISHMIDGVGFADPASGRVTRANCRSAIVVVMQSEQGTAFVVDSWAERCHTTTLTEKIFAINRKWQPYLRRFGIEASAQQGLYVDQVIREANLLREPISVVPVMQPTNQTKEFRVTVTIQRWLHNDLLYIPAAHTDLRRELEAYPLGATCDLVDALASALNMLRDPLATRQKLSYNSAWR
jgi:hypothetical protein